jgi:hypothetical protein
MAQGPHPLALALIDRLSARSHAPVLEIGAGSGRNTAALRAAGFVVTAIGAEEIARAARGYVGALSTHALLHGSPDSIASLLDQIAQRLEKAAPLYATFASIHDARYGAGVRLGDHTFAPEAGEERGVPHTYFNEKQLRTLLAKHFELEAIEEIDASAIVGRWAHAQLPAGTVHWFVHATFCHA